MAGFVRMVRTMFTQRRKTLSNALKPYGQERSVVPAQALGLAGVDGRRPVPILLPPVPDLVDMAGARVLVTDDVADTGATLGLVRDFCTGRVGDVRCAVVYEKPRSEVACEYVCAPPPPPPVV